MSTYGEDRARRIAEGPTGEGTYNGPHSRQVRRQRKRDEDREPVFTAMLTGRLANLGPRDGLLMTQEQTYFGQARKWIICPVGTREKPSADYTERYKALFPVLPGA